MIRIRISVTDTASIASSDRVANLTSLYATTEINTAATSAITIHDGLCQMPVPSKNAYPKSPTSAVDAAVNAVYVPISAQPERKPTCGPSVAPLSAYAEPAWLKNPVRRMKE